MIKISLHKDHFLSDQKAAQSWQNKMVVLPFVDFKHDFVPWVSLSALL